MALLLKLALFNALSFAATASLGQWLGCKSSLDCSLNGDCDASGACVCDAAWTGPACGQLLFGKAPTTPALYREDNSTWGLSIIRDADGIYHGFAAAFYGQCGLDSWQSNSLIWHIKSTSPVGPFVNETVVLADYDQTPYFRHNPTVAYHAASSTYVLAHIGCGNGTVQNRFSNCSGGVTPQAASSQASPLAASTRSVATGACKGYDSNAMVSSSLEGPWREVGLTSPASGSSWPNTEDNPSLLMLPNGSVWIMFRSYNGTPGSPTHSVVGIARSTSNTWDSNYTSPAHPILGSGPGGGSAPYQQLEDPFFWRDSRGYKALFHDMGGCKSFGCFAFSEDSYTWHMTSVEADGLGYAYTPTITYTNGTSQTLRRRERPHLVFAADGVTPIALSNGVLPYAANDHTFSLVVPLGAE